MLDTAGFDRLLEGADLVITGEGRIDSQSMRGKVVAAAMAPSAPFWGPNTALAPEGPHRGLSMSHMAMISTSVSLGSSPT